MDTRFVESANGTRIAYDVTGRGPALVLLHGGFIQSRRDWHASYVGRLSPAFSVITVDLPGHGESDHPTTPEAYTPEALLDHLNAVVDACGAERFLLWGYSLGGTIGLQVARRSERIGGVILAGVWFGVLFTQAMVDGFLTRLEAVSVAISEDKLDEVTMSPGERQFFADADLAVAEAYYRALAKYPAVEPHELRCPALVFAGTANVVATSRLTERKEDLEASGVTVRLFEGLDHAQEFSEVDQILPDCVSFLRAQDVPSMT